MTARGYYFGAGPATLPEDILTSAQPELLNWRGSGLSILELGHRTQAFTDLLNEAEADLRSLLQIPKNYHVLFIGGAARTHFSMIPMNFITQAKPKAGYICSGLWSKLAYEEAKRLDIAYEIKAHHIEPDSAYVYYTPNETVDGIRFNGLPEANGVPLVADMTSCILSEPIDVSAYGLIFAGAQKNIGPAGLTLVIVRDDFLQNVPKHVLPTMLDYRVHAKNHSVYATPPVFQCDMAAKMFKWVKAQGGVEALYQINQAKAQKLYDYIDASKHYTTMVEPPLRSLMNVCFSMQDKSKEASFLKAAAAKGLTGLKGHRLKGGLRASLYNAMPMAGVDALLAFMDDFIS